MRKDMFKVIVERPRTPGDGNYWDQKAYSRVYTRGAKNPDSYPKYESMGYRHGYGKSLNENLKPLRRFLLQQVGRPWDQVFSEVCKTIDSRSAVKKHVRDHLLQMVEQNTELRGKEVWRKGAYPYRLDVGTKGTFYRQYAYLYVHPLTGLLRKTRYR